MTRFVISIMLILFARTASAQKCPNDNLDSFCETSAAVTRLLAYPSYTVSDEGVLNRAGDLAALAVIRNISIEDLNSPDKARQVLLILDLAFAKPQLIGAKASLKPTAAMLLLDYLGKTKYDRASTNEIENVRHAIQHAIMTGQPYVGVTLGNAPPIDWEHTRWVNSVLRWTIEIKPGMTRKDLFKIYTTEGGLSTRTQRTYVLKGCPYIKVDIEFAPVGNERDQSTEGPDDKILKISKPYLQYSIVD